MDFNYRVDNFIKNNSSKNLLGKDDLLKLLNKWMSLSKIWVHKERWGEIIPKYDVLFGITTHDFCVVFNKTHFVLVFQQVVNHDIIHKQLEDFNKIKFTRGSFTYDDKEVTKLSGVGSLNFSKYNNLIDLVYNELIYPHLQNIEEEKRKIDENVKEEKRKTEEKRVHNLNIFKKNILTKLDSDGDGNIDLPSEKDLSLILQKHQDKIISIDRTYVQKFVKVSIYLKTKKTNTQKIFKSIQKIQNSKELSNYEKILVKSVKTYNLILSLSINMVKSLIENDMISFYEIYEMFDSLNMFDSQHEKDISNKLSDINFSLENVMNEIKILSDEIVDSVQELNITTEDTNDILKRLG